jgi:hypothetical protein
MDDSNPLLAALFYNIEQLGPGLRILNGKQHYTTTEILHVIIWVTSR